MLGWTNLARRWAFAAALAAALPVALPAGAVTQVYHSPADDGAPAAGEASVPEGGTRSVYLYIDGGNVPSLVGTACDTGQGDEICGYEMLLSGQGGLTLTAFTPDASADLVVNLSAGSIRINGLDTIAPSAGPKRIGELQVDAVPGGSLDLSAGESVGADLSENSIAATTLVRVPEPGRLMLLTSGIAMLRALGARRCRR